MTTYTLTGFAVYRNGADNVTGVDATGVTMEIVAPGSTTSFSYTVNPLGSGESPGQGDETVDIAIDDYTVRLDGTTVVGGSATDPETSIFKVDWTDAGVSKTATVLVANLAGISVPGLGVVDADYIFVMDGDMPPAISTIAQWDAFEGSITALSIPTGTYGPGTDIALDNIGATISQNDIITGTGAGDVFKGGAGADIMNGLGGNDTLNGDKGADKLFGDAGDDILNGGAGNDKLVGGKGKDTAKGGDGNDTLNGGGGVDKLFGGKGKDVLNGEKGNDILKGDKGNDTLKGGAGKDVLNGGAGNDKMSGGAGNDTFIFSAGADRITDFDAASNKEKIDLSGVGGITGFKDLKNNNSTQDGADLVIDDGAGNTLTLLGLSIGDLDKGDFIF